jgi:hypothetical protein
MSDPMVARFENRFVELAVPVNDVVVVAFVAVVFWKLLVPAKVLSVYVFGIVVDECT